MSTIDMKGTGNGNDSSSITIFSSPAFSNGCADHTCKIGENGYYMETMERRENK